jgi:hypothetical protein
MSGGFLAGCISTSAAVDFFATPFYAPLARSKNGVRYHLFGRRYNVVKAPSGDNVVGFSTNRETIDEAKMRSLM